MNSNEKPRTQCTGRINHLDGESIVANVTAIDRLKPNQEFTFGKSSPMITDRDIWEMHFLRDAGWNKSKSLADAHLQAQGFVSVWSRPDQLRAAKFNRRKAVAQLMAGDAA